MKTLAVILNIALLGVIFYVFIEYGLPGINDDFFWFVFFGALAPLFSLIALYFSPKSDNWISLYFKRKALEERRKIDQLNQE